MRWQVDDRLLHWGSSAQGVNDNAEFLKLFIDEFSQPRTPPPGQFSGGSEAGAEAHQTGRAASNGTGACCAAGQLVRYHDNGLPRMPGVTMKSTLIIENCQYMSVYRRNNLTNHLARMATRQRLQCHQRSRFRAVYTKMNRCKESPQTGTSVFQLPLNDIDCIIYQ